MILDLGVESPYLGMAYPDEAFEKRVVEEELPRAGLGQGDVPTLRDRLEHSMPNICLVTMQ